MAENIYKTKILMFVKLNEYIEFKDYNSLADDVRNIIICFIDVYPSYDDNYCNIW